jgi:hypothetical protein
VKHIKHIFENLSEDYISDIKDICIELQDLGFNIIYELKLSSAPNTGVSKIKIHISKYGSNFNSKKTVDVVARLCQYSKLNDLNFRVYKHKHKSYGSGEDITQYIKHNLFLHGEIKRIVIIIGY